MYLGVPPFGQTVRSVIDAIATNGQTTFTVVGGYLPGYIDVLVNGHELPTTDVTASDGATVTLANSLFAADEVKFKVYWPVSWADTVRRSGDTMAGNLAVNVSGGTGVLRATGNSAVTGYIFGSSGGGVVGIGSETNHAVALYVNNTERGRIDTSGNFGIGTASPSTWGTKLVVYNNQLTVTGGGYDATFADSIFFGGNAEGTTYRNKISNSLSSNAVNQQMKFSVASGSSTFVDALTMNGAGAVALSGGAKNVSGVGIVFPATQSASTNANTLDDYEEGTWTPTWYGSATAGTPSGYASGTYTKIGNMVTVFANFTAINLTGATGVLYVSGLPFTHASGGQGVCYWEGITPTYAKATVTGSGLMVSSVGGTAVAFKPSITTLWDNYLLASSTFNGGGGSTYGYFTLTYFV